MIISYTFLNIIGRLSAEIMLLTLVSCLIQHNVNTHVFKNTLNIWLLISTLFLSRPIVLLPVLLLQMLAKHVMTWWVEFLNPPMLECLQWTIMFQLPMGPPHSIHFSQTILDPIVTKIVVSIEYHTQYHEFLFFKSQIR